MIRLIPSHLTICVKLLSNSHQTSIFTKHPIEQLPARLARRGTAKSPDPINLNICIASCLLTEPVLKFSSTERKRRSPELELPYAYPASSLNKLHRLYYIQRKRGVTIHASSDSQHNPAGFDQIRRTDTVSTLSTSLSYATRTR